MDGVVGGKMVIELLAGKMRLDRGGIAAGEDDMRQLEEQRIHGFLQLPLQVGTFHTKPSPATGTVNLVGEMLGDELFLRNLTAFVHRLLTAGNGFGDIPIVSLNGDVQPTTTAVPAHFAA